MHLFLKLCTISSFIATVDIAQPSVLFDTKEAQHFLVHRALGRDFIRHARGQAHPSVDVCDWEMTECKDGMLTSICASGNPSSGDEAFSAEMEWLPPTVQFIHFYYVRAIGIWLSMCFPRDLKYLYLRVCYGMWTGNGSKAIDFARLPRKMEELISIHSIMSGTICFDGLPETMRFVYIEKQWRSFRSVIVNYENLPQSLKHLHVTDSLWGKRMNRRVKENGVPHAVRLCTSYDSGVPKKHSTYMKLFEEKMK